MIDGKFLSNLRHILADMIYVKIPSNLRHTCILAGMIDVKFLNNLETFLADMIDVKFLSNLRQISEKS